VEDDMLKTSQLVTNLPYKRMGAFYMIKNAGNNLSIIRKHPLELIEKKVIEWSCIAFAAFGILTNSWWMLSSIEKSGVFLAFTLFIIFLSKPLKFKQKNLHYLDWFLAILGIIVGFYTTFTAKNKLFPAKPTIL
jgi:TRAP-type uncharacterized transport system fused permease subunit